VTAWKGHPARVELLALYAEVEALVAPCSCDCATTTRREDARCCQFRVTGREPYPTPVELAEVDHAIRARGASRQPAPGKKKKLVMVDDRGSCPLLSEEGRCTIYASRPFGCRTFFCTGHEPPRKDRVAIQAIGRRISDLAARIFPTMPLPRPLTRALAGPLPTPAK
jgi:hypothetical protein